MTPAQRDAWFSYHPPTPETAPKYAAIREAEKAAAMVVDSARFGDVDYGRVNVVMLAFADAIAELAPNCADRTAAIRCVRLARNAANEALAEGMVMAQDLLELSGTTTPIEDRGPWISALCGEARSLLIHARWQANSAIACGGV